MDEESEISEKITLDIGAKLRSAREAAGLAIEDVASELRIHTHYVEDIENNQFDNLNGPTYVKGYLRNYARYLEIDGEPLVASYQSTIGDVPAWQASQPIQPEHTHRKGLLAGSLLIGIILLALFATWLLKSGYLDRYKVDDQVADVATETVAEESVGETAVGTTEAQVETETGSQPVSALTQTTQQPPTAAAETATETAAVPETAPTAEEEPKADENTIVLGEDDIITAPGDSFTDEIIITFSDECWVEIEDAGRHQLMHGLYQADDIKIILGQAPFQVFLGNASAVDIDFNGLPFDVEGNTRRNNTARFALISQ